MTNVSKTKDLLRQIGVMAVAIAAAWLVQVFDFGSSSAFGKMMWVVSAAAIAGAGTGLIVTSATAPDLGEASRA